MFRSRLMEHFDLMEFDEAEKLKTLPFFLDGTIYKQWMTAPGEHKKTFRDAIKWLDEGHEREKDLEGLQAKFRRIKYPGPQKISIRGFLTDLKLYAAEAWPDTNDDDDENKIARELAINQKFWDALPGHVKDHVKARTGKRHGIKTEEMLETAESIMTSRDEEVAEEAPYRYSSVKQVAARPKNPKNPGKVPIWVSDIRRKHQIMTTEMQLENQKQINDVTQRAMKIAQTTAQQAQTQPQQQPQPRGGGGRGRGSRGRGNVEKCSDPDPTKPRCNASGAKSSHTLSGNAPKGRRTRSRDRKARANPRPGTRSSRNWKPSSETCATNAKRSRKTNKATYL